MPTCSQTSHQGPPHHLQWARASGDRNKPPILLLHGATRSAAIERIARRPALLVGYSLGGVVAIVGEFAQKVFAESSPRLER
ncbi:MAG: hypothetical protein WB757_02265 [Candidatus Cybelea sp.]|jgi:hypothetical protein